MSGVSLYYIGESMAEALAPHISVQCEKCGSPMQGCYRASEGLKLKAWLCTSCLWYCKPVGREWGLTLGDGDAS
jgi:hypothetical protein